MTSTKKDPILVVVQLSGGNDGINTVVPYGDPHYYDQRPSLGIPADAVLALDDHVGFHPSMGPLKNLYDEGKVAVIQGVGFPNCNRSHFRSMDVWHTCEPDILATEGWLGRTIRDIDPQQRECTDRGQLRSWAAPRIGPPRRSRRFRGQPGHLWRAYRHRGRRTGHGPGYLQPDLLSHPGRDFHLRLPFPDRYGRPEGGRRFEDRARTCTSPASSMGTIRWPATFA